MKLILGTVLLIVLVTLVLLVTESSGWRRRRRAPCSWRACQWSSWARDYSVNCYGSCHGSGVNKWTRYKTVTEACGGSCSGEPIKTRSCTGNCNGHGSWSGYNCRCNDGYKGLCCQTKVQCSALHLSNGQLSSSDTSYEATVTFTCNPGYERIGYYSTQCIGHGYWTNAAPTCKRKICPQLTPPEYGSMSDGGEYGDVVTFSCNTGYQLTGSSALTCQASGLWSGSSAVCNIVSCADLPAPTHGSVSGGYSYQDIKTFICDAGYELTGSPIRECTEAGTWTGTQTICNRKKCPTLQAPGHGSINGTYFLGDSVIFTCNADYELVGSSVRTCQATQQWTGFQPRCVEKRCPNLSSPSNGQMIGGVVTGDLLWFTCDLGYQLVGSDTLLCLDDKTWNGSRPNCERIVCPTPEVPTNGEVSGGRKYGDTATYTCDVGYRLDGSHTRVCLATGAWSDTAPQCERKTCRLLLPPLHGVVSGGHHFGDVATYTCNTGYDLIGSHSRTCQDNQLWAGSPPICQLVQCSTLHPPTQGTMSGGNNYNDTVYFSCDTGHDLRGSANRTCQADGSWSGSQPTCLALECPEVDTPLHGEKTGGTSVGSYVIFFCDNGYDLIGGDFMRTCEADQTWSGTQPSCQRKKCPELSLPYNGNVTGGNEYGDVVTFTCAAGYDLTGSETITCQGNAQWSGMQPSCSRVQCTALSPIANGQMTYAGGTFYGDIVSFLCNSGYELSGSSSRLCQSDRSWSGMQPSCVPINCSNLTPPLNGAIDGGNKLGDAAVYSCEEGYEMQGSAVRYCMPDQTWSGEETTCEIKECPLLDPPPNGGINGTNYFGDTVIFDCDEGYNLVGSPFLQCESDRGWSGVRPYCEKVRCAAPSSPANGAVSNGSFYEDTVSYKCNTGYKLIGSSTQTCQANGQWLGIAPTCVRIECEPLDAPTNGNSFGGHFYGDQVIFTCDTGFKLNSSNVRVCGGNGTWGGLQSTCEAIECESLKTPSNSDTIRTGNTYGDTVTSNCDPGYELLSGNTVRTCQANGEWSGMPVVCQKKCCVQPYLQDGSYHGTNCYNETVSFQCDNGHYLTSPHSALTCTETGTWDKPIPQCNEVCCSAPTSVDNGYVTTQTGYCFDSTIQIHCDQGYKLTNNAGILYCNSSGIWEGDEPICEKIDCGDPGELRNAQRILAGTFYGDTVTYICDPGFILVGNGTSTCDGDGQWDRAPFCEPHSLCNRTHLPVPKDGAKVCFDSPQGTTPVEYCQMHCNAPLVYNRDDAMYQCSAVTSWRWMVPTVITDTTNINIVQVGECSVPWNPFALITVSGLVITAGQPLDMQAIKNEMRVQLRHLGFCNSLCEVSDDLEIGKITVEIFNARRRSGGIQYQISVQFRAYADPALITPTNTIQMEWVRLAGEMRQQALDLQTMIHNGGLSLSVQGLTLSVADDRITISNPNVDECADPDICPNARCINRPGSYSCQCLTGYDGPACADIDECRYSGFCPDHSTCTNTDGDYFCTCEQGYQLEGDNCEDCTMFHGKCFIVSDTPTTFTEAEMKCAEGGGTVINVKEQHTQDFLVQLLSVSNKDVWIGLTDQDVEGQFVWTDGTPLVYSNWAPGEPNGDTTKNCVHLWPMANFRWDDMPCGRSNYYICQYTIT
ncbi:CSMD3 [Branchiostoma lanceolatum]|uniref:CSMD3 protein n=1 Tax=Branchiostoma lanceolatum TaxID=7740 RepID=A0A8J9Z7E4_BRALA|nr:CSMD3 [Branchiostoma lanceolatum]